MSVYEETEDVNKGEQSVTVVRLSRRLEGGGKGANTAARTGVILQSRGIKGDRLSLCQ